MVTTPFHLTATDLTTLGMTDEDFIPYTWTHVRNAIGVPLSVATQNFADSCCIYVHVVANDLSILPRMPSVLRRYIAWSQQTIADWGSTAIFIVEERLHWEARGCPYSLRLPVLPKNRVPFADKSDYKILYNDWPYGLTSDITHLVVWLKTPLAVRKGFGEMTAESNNLVRDFVDRTFVQSMRKEGAAEDSVLYFKNVARLQSVGALEHFHVLLRGVKKELLDEWTDGDVPLYKK